MRGLKLFLMATLMFSAPANAIFFFVIPIPKGKVNPDSVNATLEQRRHSMCAAYHLNVVDPELSGKKENSWRGEIVNAAGERMVGFPEFKKLTGIYIRQWQLQMKSSYQAGMAYSQMLADACNKIVFPYDKSQYEDWKMIKLHAPNAKSVEELQIDSQPINVNAWFANAQWPKDARAASITKTIASVRVSSSGDVTFCEVDQSSKNASLDTQACELIRKNGKFSPQIEGFRLTGSDHTISVDWPSMFSQQTQKTPPTQRDASRDVADPTFEMAVNRCTKMGYVPSTPDYKTCVSQQLTLLSR